MDERTDGLTHRTRQPSIEVTGPWFVFPLNRIPWFVWIGAALFVLLMLILHADGRLPTDPRFLGTWDAYIADAENPKEWKLSATPHTGGILTREGHPTVSWWVEDGGIAHGLDFPRLSRSSVAYKIVEIDDNRILLRARVGGCRVELKRRQ
jgi:hypothetical protein